MVDVLAGTCEDEVSEEALLSLIVFAFVVDCFLWFGFWHAVGVL